MKKLLFGLAEVFCLSLYASLTDGLVGWYKFDGEANDYSGHGNDLVNNGAIPCSDRMGHESGAYYFDGESTLWAREKSIMACGCGTISFWAKPESVISQFYTESTWGTNYEAPYIFYPAQGEDITGTNSMAGIGIALGQNGLMVYEHADCYLPTPLVLEQDFGTNWIHVTVIAEAKGTESVFINGELIRTGLATSKEKLLAFAYTSYKEGIAGGNRGKFKGCIDELRIYNRVISAAGIKALYNGIDDGGPYWEDGWKFSIKDGEAIVLGASNLVGDVVMPDVLGRCPVTGIDRSAFEREVGLVAITIPASITNIGYFAFRDCLRLTEVKFLGNRPHVDLGAFMGVPAYAVVSSKEGSVTAVLPTEVGGDVLEVPEGWLDEIATHHKGDTPAGYSSYEEAFAAKFGSDLTKALSKPTGKRDSRGNAMMVWQDFVAGTDPLDEEDSFRATITLEDGVPKVHWEPELTAEQAEKRSYKTLGKTALKDGGDWVDVTSLSDEARQEAGYQFFKVTVEMK